MDIFNWSSVVSPSRTEEATYGVIFITLWFSLLSFLLGQRLYPRAATGNVRGLIDPLLVCFAKLSFFFDIAGRRV